MTSERRATGIALAAILVLAFNLRPVAVSVGPLLDEVSRGTGLGPFGRSLLTTLPVLAFALVGAVAPLLARRLGVHRVALGAVAVSVAGLAGRAVLDAPLGFLLLSFAALAGMAVANVLLPSLVRRHFPERIGLVTALYSTSFALGVAASSALSVPVARGLGSWRWGIGVWAATAVLAAVPLLVLARHDRVLSAPGSALTLGAVARSRVGWLVAVVFGLQAVQAYTIFGWLATVYVDAGTSAADAGFMLGLITATSVPLSFLFPAVVARGRHTALLAVAVVACYPAGYLGLVLAPDAVPWLWAVLLGVGQGSFPVIMALIALRARTPEGTAALSGFAQSVGYLFAIPGPFLVGIVHEATDGWTVPLVGLSVLAGVLAVLLAAATRAGSVEDELAGRALVAPGRVP
ncbi:MAG: MFS transporter [Nocardioidaceae bacterium]|nr:MFS transporter [Nocardioidaceae bacterium]